MSWVMRRPARRLAARLADLDEERCKPVTLGKPRKRLLQNLPGSRLLRA